MGKLISLYGGRDPREVGMYTVGEAAMYLGIPTSTLGAWIGRKTYRVHGQPRRMRGLIKVDRATGLLSFNNFVEAYVLASLRRRHELPMPRVRTALTNIGGDRPLLDTVIRTDGRGIFVEKVGALVDASQGGQAVIREVVEGNLERIEFDEQHRPSRLYPWRRDMSEPRIIALDPRRAFGKPTLAGRGVKIDVIIDRHRAGESVAALAKDYNVTGDKIEGVLRWGLDAAKAAA